MSIQAAVAPNRVLADLIPTVGSKAIVRDITLVLGGAALTGLSAQVAIPVPALSPVPFVLTTLTVLMLGAAYGPVRAAASMGIYLLVGMAGVPWFSEGASGMSTVTLGYVLGFVVAATLTGALARRGGDRTVVRMSGIMVLGTLAIYAIGVPYLIVVTGMPISEGLIKGAAVFVVTDVIKLVIAAAALPTVWALIRRFSA